MSEARSLSEVIRPIWANHRPGQVVNDDSHVFNDLGATSLVAVLITDDVSRAIERAVPPQVLFDNPVFTAYVNAVEQSAGQS